MSAEWVTAIATAGTFLVIAITAIAAVVQLRHIRAANYLSILNKIEESFASPEYREAFNYVLTEFPKAYNDATERKALLGTVTPPKHARANLISNTFDGIGMAVRRGFIAEDVILDSLSGPILLNWNALSPWIYNRRKSCDDSTIAENFEYLAVLSKRFHEMHPEGFYPKNMERMPPEAPWPELDDQQS